MQRDFVREAVEAKVNEVLGKETTIRHLEQQLYSAIDAVGLGVTLRAAREATMDQQLPGIDPRFMTDDEAIATLEAVSICPREALVDQHWR